MKKLVVLSAFVLGLSSFAFGQNNQGQKGNGQGQNGNSQGNVAMPEGTVVELPLFIGGLGLWLWWRHRSGYRLRSQKQGAKSEHRKGPIQSNSE